MADSESQPATSIQARPSPAQQTDVGPRPSQPECDESPPRRSLGATIALWLILFTFFVFLGQIAIELIVGLVRKVVP